MKAPGDAALELPWLPPSASALAALTRPHAASIWTHVRVDPGCVLLLARTQSDAASFSTAALGSLSILENAAQFLANSALPLMSWRDPAIALLPTIAQRQAWLAAELALHVPGCDPDRAWTGGLLAPLGWLALAVNEPAQTSEALRQLHLHSDVARWQRETWGFDHTALSRRLARIWRLPSWLVPILGHLGLHVRVAERLEAEPRLFQVVQLAIALLQERDRGLALPVGAAVDELANNLSLSTSISDTLAERAVQMPLELPPADAGWTATSLTDLLRLAVDQRRQHDTMARLQHDLDQLQQALEQQCHEEKERLHASKLAAVAELAAGAGHEINNPLAVISGQAQYLLKQIALAEEQLVEDPSPTLYLDSLKSKLHKSLTTIVGQAHRIHHVLTDLMQFARPTTPRKQPIALAALVREAATTLNGAVDEKKVRLTCGDAPAELVVRGDAAQWRTVLTNVLRNAVEAAPTEGWVRLRVERDGPQWVDLIVEDNGPGPAPALREHLFDPFFSGRSAGRGRGLGLSTAWRLARQNGGDVRFVGAHHEATRFVLRLPVNVESVVVPSSNGNGHASEAVKRNGSHAVPL